MVFKGVHDWSYWLLFWRIQDQKQGRDQLVICSKEQPTWGKWLLVITDWCMNLSVWERVHSEEGRNISKTTRLFRELFWCGEVVTFNGQNSILRFLTYVLYKKNNHHLIRAGTLCLPFVAPLLRNRKISKRISLLNHWLRIKLTGRRVK